MEERAIPILERVIKLYPMYSPPKVMLVRALVNKGDEQAATAVARRTVRAHPNLSEVHDHLINLLIGKEDWSGTMDAVHGAIAANPNRVSLWFAYARIKRITGQLDSAVVGIEQGLLLDPDHSDLQAEVIDLGKILLEKRQFEDCLRISRTSLEAKPKDPSLWSLVGASSLGLRQFKEAHDAYRAALGYDPGDEAAQIGLAKSLAEMGNGEESRGILESILSRNPGNAEAKQLMNKLAE
jgi:tetratricopeptide (TPR) repeat protein